VAKNIVKNVISDGGSGVNIMMEELRKLLRLPNPKPTPNFGWWIKPSAN
jgi:hypothetical protein